MNTLILAGNVARIQANSAGNHRVTIATDTWQGKDKGSVTQFIQASALLPSINKTIEKAVAKGDYVTVRCEVRNNNYTDKDGNKQYTYDFIIQELTLQGKPSPKTAEKETSADSDDYSDV